MPRINQTSLFTFTDNPAGTYRYAPDAEPAFDDSFIRNHIQVNGPDGEPGRTGSGVATDSTSTTDYGIVVEQIDSQLTTGGERQALAEYRAYLYAQPRIRLPELRLDGTINPAAMWPAILSLEISDAITVERFAGLTSPMSLDLVCEGFRLAGNATHPFQTSVRTSPRDAKQYWTIGDATLGAINDPDIFIAP